MIKNKLKLGLVGLAVLVILGVASQANAAALTWSANQTIDLSSPDVNLTIVSGSSATSIIVGTEDIQVVVPEGITFTVTSASAGLRVVGDTTSGISNTCSDTGSIATVVITGGAAGETITVAPTTSLCEASDSGGGGGGGKHVTDDTPTVPEVPPVVPQEGCSAGNIYNTATGALCINNAVEPQGCSAGNIYNTSTGALCVNNQTLQIPGCGNRETGFSTATGVSCVGNHVTTVTPPASSNGYAFGNTLVKLGTKGGACQAWQTFLNDHANAGLAVDGACGKLTMAAARAWQTAQGLVSDGLLGAKSRAKANAQ